MSEGDGVGAFDEVRPEEGEFPSEWKVGMADKGAYPAEGSQAPGVVISRGVS